jgi:hypothetical protein
MRICMGVIRKMTASVYIGLVPISPKTSPMELIIPLVSLLFSTNASPILN